MAFRGIMSCSCWSVCLLSVSLVRTLYPRFPSCIPVSSYLTSDLSSVDDSGDEEPTTQSDRSEGIQGTLKTLISKLDDLGTCNDLIAKHGAALQRSLSELEALRVPVEGGEKIKGVNERATLFRITSNAMINVSSET